MKLTTVIAGAGFGKTTLIAEASHFLGLATVWFRLDRTDTDLFTFLGYLIEGLREHFPEFGNETLGRMEEAEIAGHGRHAILTVFLSELEETVRKDLIIVLDDYHLVEEIAEIKKSLVFILDRLPPFVHLVIISRSEPDLHLSKFRAAREVLDIREKDIAFTITETEQLYSQLFNVSLQNDSLEILQRKTEGWVSGLVLFYHFSRGKSPSEIETLLLRLKGSHKAIASYLEENVYELQTDESKDFLAKTSILSRLSPAFCDQFLGTTNSRKILKGFEENHLFTFPFDEEGRWYYYHHLFQEFLLTKLHTNLSRNAIQELHKNAALLWERQGEEEEALKHYLNAEQFDKACALLRRLGEGFIKEVRVQLIQTYISKVPDRYLDEEPWIRYTKARALEISGQRQEAIQAYKKACRDFRKHGSQKGAAMCLSALGSNYYVSGDFPKAEKKFKELLNQITGNPRLKVEIMGNLVFVLSLLGKISAADRYFNKAMSLLSQSENRRILAWLYFARCFRYLFSGEFAEALESGRQAEEICRRNHLYHLLANVYHGMSSSCYFLGRFAEGIEIATRGLTLVEERGFQDSSRAWLLTDLAINSVGLGKTSKALEESMRSLEIFQDQESLWGQSWAYYVLCNACMESGKVSQAEAYARAGIELTGGITGPLQESILKVSLAECTHKRKRWNETQLLLDEAAKSLKSSKFYLSKVYLLYARSYWEQRRKKAALEKLLLGLQLCAENNYDGWIIAEKHWIVPLLVETFAMGKMQDYLKRIFKESGSYAKKDLKLLQENKNRNISRAASRILDEIKKAPPPALRVFCLGQFRVFRGDEEIPAQRWKSRKAMMLFKYLVYARSRGFLSKEILIEFLWPKGDPQKTSKRFHVALPSLRKTLEPEIAPGTPSSYILREGSSYRLNLGDEGWIDVDEFCQELKLAEKEADPEKSINHYLTTEALYKGDFLEEDIFVEWCIEERACIKDQYLGSLMKIMRYFERKGDFPRCIEYARKYLRHDEYAEDIYKAAMRYYSETGNNAMVVRTFEKCKKKIQEELDSPLSKETLELFQKLNSV